MNSYSYFICFNIYELVYVIICETICDLGFLGTDCAYGYRVWLVDECYYLLVDSMRAFAVVESLLSIIE